MNHVKEDTRYGHHVETYCISHTYKNIPNIQLIWISKISYSLVKLISWADVVMLNPLTKDFDLKLFAKWKICNCTNNQIDWARRKWVIAICINKISIKKICSYISPSNLKWLRSVLTFQEGFQYKLLEIKAINAISVPSQRCLPII